MSSPSYLEQSLSPITPQEAGVVWRESAGKLFSAAYLQGFSPDRIQHGRWKFGSFETWWKTLNEDQKIRVKGCLAGEIY